MCDDALYNLYTQFQKRSGRDSVGEVKRVLAGLKVRMITCPPSLPPSLPPSSAGRTQGRWVFLLPPSLPPSLPLYNLYNHFQKRSGCDSVEEVKRVLAGLKVGMTALPPSLPSSPFD